MRLVKLAAKLVDTFTIELQKLRAPRILAEQSAALARIPLPKPDAPRPSIIPNFLDAKAQEQPEHIDFDNLLHGARSAIVRDTALETDFRYLAAAIVKGARNRISEAEMARWPFRNCFVSPAFIREVLERKGL